MEPLAILSPLSPPGRGVGGEGQELSDTDSALPFRAHFPGKLAPFLRYFHNDNQPKPPGEFPWLHFSALFRLLPCSSVAASSWTASWPGWSADGNPGSSRFPRGRTWTSSRRRRRNPSPPATPPP